MNSKSTEHIDWSSKRGIATESNINEFVESVGGELIDSKLPKSNSQRADYLFEEQKIIIELKTLETEFGLSEAALSKMDEAVRIMSKRFGLGQILRHESDVTTFHSRMRSQIYGNPLNRIVKKAHAQIRETKKLLKDESLSGILWLVNDNFRELRTEEVLRLIARNLMRNPSQIRALIYQTNHYVHIPGNQFANLLWIPLYAEEGPRYLSEFINWLGKEWGDFCERKTGPFDFRWRGPDLDIEDIEPIREE